MTFYFFIALGADAPPLQVYHFEHGDTWVAIGGCYEDLLQSPRAERLLRPGDRKDGPGPRWIVIPFLWRPYRPSTVISSHDPVAPFLWKPDVPDLLTNREGSRISAERVQRMLDATRTFVQIAERLRDSAPPAFFLRNGARIKPTDVDFLSIQGRGEADWILECVREFNTAVMDHVSFTAWFTLNFRGWEEALSPEQLKTVRDCQFKDRPKKGCLLNLLVGYPLVNFERWIKHKVPVYYIFTEAMYYLDRFVRVRPDIIQDYWERRLCQNTEEDLKDFYRLVELATIEYNDFFQQRLQRRTLVDTPHFPYRLQAMYSEQICQGYRPYIVHNPALAKLLLERYEAINRPETPGRIRMARWAAREPYRGPEDEREFTMDPGTSGLPSDLPFPGKSFDRESQWVENNYLTLRELFKLSFAPQPGEAYDLEGGRSAFPLEEGGGLKEFEKELVARAVYEGKKRPEEYLEFHDWEIGWGGQVEWMLSIAQTASAVSDDTEMSDPCSLKEGELTDDSHESSTGSDEFTTAPLSRPSLGQRITDPTTGEPVWQGGLAAQLSSPSEVDRRRGRRARWEDESSEGEGTPASSVASSGRVWQTERRSASPVQASRLADPGRASSKVYSEGHTRWKEVEEGFWKQLDELANRMTMPQGPYVRDDVRRPRIEWSDDFVARGLLHVHGWEDRIRLLLYAIYHQSLRTPVHVLDFVVEKGMKVSFLVPRDPVPTLAQIGSRNPPSTTLFSPLSGRTPREVFRIWESQLQGPAWAKTHFAAFLAEGGTIAYLVRHYAKDYLNYAGSGVSPESRAYTLNSFPLPVSCKLGGNYFVVRDVAGDTELEAIGGQVANPRDEMNPYYVVPPTATFNSPEWIIGTGEWGEAEEAYLNEVLHRWKTRKEMNLRTATQWAKHAGVWVHAYKQRRPEEAKRERVPSGSECEEWCKKLEEAFGVSLEFRKIADLVKPLKAKNLRQFR
ncbi:uncharacterized protein SCHCODRAFT_01086444 [Schizophyllum commune H4-8]|uniref:uncharacterized protein n=1 Tax=Schizophyllum commune (strain H4-8 / FGSC 9210) TaxID=578458 RepID=UPI00215F50EC|nr:uncharacterized protein SCHCODRAFT_01086444 [Schizophyllum commune H4-8]KAI5900016.1 hypothetical protein SCHCODRAFT_01086444 [Schizophyllum commune H4-8]